ncbi:RES family NAD+ phosphorylase [Aerosakkonema sp. BLCC-F183]|uniref:RES family NAD+ phosphorylase n=1 Tax=Aerosakkonema sp. BLCC-F183 TaxID=3342834 RepID=UPI0035B6B639
MVRIDPPPPQRPPSPSIYTLATGTEIVRIFNTDRGTTALTFRYFGPLSRFDHHRVNPTNKPANDPERGIYYAAFDLQNCLVEVFGDTGIINVKSKDWYVAIPNLTRDLQLLDLRGSGAMKAGSVAALAKVADRTFSQEWSRYFYENEDIYTKIDGLIYFNAHNDAEALALYERASDGLSCNNSQIIRLDNDLLRPLIREAAASNNMIVIPY